MIVGLRLVGERLRAPAHDDRRQVVAVRPAALLGLAHHLRRRLEDRRRREPVGDLALATSRSTGRRCTARGCRRCAAACARDRSITGSTRPPRQLKILLRSGCSRDLVGADDALVDQVLHLRVVLGAADQAALPEQVEARIADVRPVRVARLHDAGDAGRARRLQHRELVRVGAERRVRAHHRVLQELERIACRIGFASCWKRSMNSRTAICAAISPPAWPPMPSATTSSSVSRPYVYAIRSWLTLREPLRDSWKIVKRMPASVRQSAGARYAPISENSIFASGCRGT